MQGVHFIANGSVFAFSWKLLRYFRGSGKLGFAENGHSSGHGPWYLGQHPCMNSANVIPVETLQQSVSLGINVLGMTVPLKCSERMSDSQEQCKAVTRGPPESWTLSKHSGI